MYELEFIIVTFNRPKYLKDTLESFIKLKEGFNTRLIILNGGSDNFLEEISGVKLNSTQVYNNFIKKYNCQEIVDYKHYNNNGNWHEIISDYVYNLTKAKYFAIIGDDDVFLNFSGFDKAVRLQENKFESDQIGIINLFYQDNTRKNVIPIIDETIDGLKYLNNFIDLNYLDNQSVMHLYNIEVIKKNNCLKFLKLREQGLEDFFGWDIYFIFNIASNSKILYVNSFQTIEMGHHGNEIRYTVKFPLTQWICYYLYSKHTVNKLFKEKKLDRKRKRKFLLHWINSFFICYSTYLFSRYETREADYNKVKNYIDGSILTYVIKEIMINGFLINSKIIVRICWIILLKTRIVNSILSLFLKTNLARFKTIIESVIKKIKK